MSQIINIENELSDLESIIESKSSFKLDNEVNLFFEIMALDIDQNWR